MADTVIPAIFAIYLAGVVIGLLGTDARPGTRLLLALLWPVGPAAFVLTVTMLLLVAPWALIRFRSNAGAGTAAR